MQWIIPLHYLLMWYSLMKVKLPRLCCWHLINCQEMAVRGIDCVCDTQIFQFGRREKYLFCLQIINKGWLLVHLLLGNLLFSKLLAFWGACEYVMGAMLLPSYYKSNHPLLRVCCNPKQTVSTITSHLQSLHTHRKRGLNSFWKCL